MTLIQLPHYLEPKNRKTKQNKTKTKPCGVLLQLGARRAKREWQSAGYLATVTARGFSVPNHDLGERPSLSTHSRVPCVPDRILVAVCPGSQAALPSLWVEGRRGAGVQVSHFH